MSQHFSLAPVGLLACGALLIAAPSDDEPINLRTQYTPGLELRTDVRLHHESELTSFTMIRDGQEVDMGGRTMGGPSQTDRHAVIIDAFTAATDGLPDSVQRTFELLESGTTRMRRDEEVANEWSGPLEGVTLGLSREEGELVVEVQGGDEPDDEALLAGHTLTLALDALLPTEPVALGAEWEADGAALLRALGLDMDAKLFKAPPRPEPEAGGPGGGPGGRGGFGGGRGMGGGGFAQLFLDADWDVEVTLADELVEMDGLMCYALEFEAEGEAEVASRGFGGFGGGRGGRALELGMATPLALEGTGVLELDGTLYFAKDEARPVALVVEGETSVDEHTEREGRDGGMIETSSTTSGTLTLEIHVGPNEDDGE